jgi:WD40 repeat protein
MGASTVGNYNVTVTAVSGSFTHSIVIGVRATAKPQYALVTSFEGQLYKLQNGTLTLIGQPVTGALRQIAWKPDGSYALISGDSGVLMKWDGTQLTQVVTSISSGTDLNTVVWSPDGSYALLGGTDGALFKYDGVSVTSIPNPSTGQVQGISWNPSGTVALLVGNSGTLLRYQNGVITVLSSGTSNTLYGVAWNPNGQYALIGGAGGSILRSDGTTVTALNTSGLYSTSSAIRFIAWNSAGTLAILVGNAGGVVLTYDGTNLTGLSPVTSNGLFSVAWSGDTATIVGNSGTMLTYSGGVLKTVSTGVSSSFRGIAWKPA